MRAVLQQLAPAFEKSSGHNLVIEYATAGKVEEKVVADEAIDVAILTKPRAEKLVRSAKLVGGTATVLARVPIGLAVKKGAPHPDISSVEAFKRTLLNAKSIAYVDPASGGTSGIYLAQALEKLGIATELKSKIRLVSPPAGQSSPRVGEVVQRGRGRDRHTADQRADGDRRHRYCRPATGRSAKPGLGLHGGFSNPLRAAAAGQGADRFPGRTCSRTGLQGKWHGAGITTTTSRKELTRTFGPWTHQTHPNLALSLHPDTVLKAVCD